MSERPTGSPLHGKRVYAYIGQTDGLSTNFVSFATEFSFNLSAQNTSRAVVMGADAVPDVEVHGIAGRLRLNLLLTSTESDILAALTAQVTPDAFNTEVDYDQAVVNMSGANPTFINAARLDVILASLENTPLTASASDNIANLRTQNGYIIELNSAAIVGFEITGRVGEYTTARLEVESGRFRINANEAP